MVEYLKFKKINDIPGLPLEGSIEWKENHRRYYQIADITIQIDSDLPITDSTFHQKFRLFEVDKPGEDIISIRHHFSLPDLNNKSLGKEVYRKPPWAIYKKGNSWIYTVISPSSGDNYIYHIAVFNYDHTKSIIYSDNKEIFSKGGLHSLTLFPTDQILLARILADRQSCYLHSSGVIFNHKGLLFVGHSEAGKSTIVKMLKDRVKILCDDRMIVRRWQDGFRIHGTWSHGEVSEVSADSAPLRAILFLKKTHENLLIPLNDRKEINKKLLAYLIKPFVTAEWWNKILSLVEKISSKVPCYSLHFDKSGKVVDSLMRFLGKKGEELLDV